MGQTSLLPFRRKACWGFFRPENPTDSVPMLNTVCMWFGYCRPEQWTRPVLDLLIARKASTVLVRRVTVSFPRTTERHVPHSLCNNPVCDLKYGSSALRSKVTAMVLFGMHLKVFGTFIAASLLRSGPPRGVSSGVKKTVRWEIAWIFPYVKKRSAVWRPAIFVSTSMFKPYPANVDNMATSTNASKWRMGFNSAFKGLKQESVHCTTHV